MFQQGWLLQSRAGSLQAHPEHHVPVPLMQGMVGTGRGWWAKGGDGGHGKGMVGMRREWWAQARDGGHRIPAAGPLHTCPHPGWEHEKMPPRGCQTQLQ